MFAFVLIYKLTNPIPFVFFSNKKVEILRGAQGGENGLKKVCVCGGLGYLGAIAFSLRIICFYFGKVTLLRH